MRHSISQAEFDMRLIAIEKALEISGGYSQRSADQVIRDAKTILAFIAGVVADVEATDEAV